MISARATSRRGKMVFEPFSDPPRLTVHRGQDAARALHHLRYEPAHLLLGVLAVRPILVEAFGVDARRVERATVRLLAERPKGPPPAHIPFTAAAKRVIEATLELARNRNDAVVRVDHLLAALSLDTSGAPAQALGALGLSRELLLDEGFMTVGAATARATAISYARMRDTGVDAAYLAVACFEHLPARALLAACGINCDQACEALASEWPDCGTRSSTYTWPSTQSPSLRQVLTASQMTVIDTPHLLVALADTATTVGGALERVGLRRTALHDALIGMASYERDQRPRRRWPRRTAATARSSTPVA